MIAKKDSFFKTAFLTLFWGSLKTRLIFRCPLFYIKGENNLKKFHIAFLKIEVLSKKD